MRFSLAATLACASAAIAAPSACPAPNGEQVSTTSKHFGVMSIRSGSAVHYAGWGASLNEIGAGLQQQNASCDAGAKATSATFYISDGALYLYTNGAPWQEVWVDRSGMGMGNVGYTTGAQPPPKNGERKGWSIDENDHLLFGGKGFLACPAKDGFSIWAETGTDKPGWNEGCMGIAARVIAIDKPVGCQYTSQQ